MEGGTAGASGPTCQECGTDLDPGVNYCPECGATAPDEELAAYCRVCGSEFEPDDRFCSDCGAVRNPSAEDTEGSATDSGSDDEDSQQEFRRRVQTYLASGWEIEHDYGDSVVLVDRDYGSLGAHTLLLLFTGGFGNLVYAWYRYSANAERKHLSAGGADVEQAIEGLDKSDSGSLAIGATLLVLGALVVIGSPLDAGAWIMGLAMMAGGAYWFPPTRRRIDRRYSVTEFGDVRTTDEEVVQSPDKPCVVCGRPIDQGVKRSYREEKAFAGIPLFTTSDGENHYCETCAAADRDLGVSDPDLDLEASTETEEQLEYDLE